MSTHSDLRHSRRKGLPEVLAAVGTIRAAERPTVLAVGKTNKWMDRYINFSGAEKSNPGASLGSARRISTDGQREVVTSPQQMPCGLWHNDRGPMSGVLFQALVLVYR